MPAKKVLSIFLLFYRAFLMAGGYSNIHYFITVKTKIFSWNPLLKNQIGYQEEPMKQNK